MGVLEHVGTQAAAANDAQGKHGESHPFLTYGHRSVGMGVMGHRGPVSPHGARPLGSGEDGHEHAAVGNHE